MTNTECQKTLDAGTLTVINFHHAHQPSRGNPGLSGVPFFVSTVNRPKHRAAARYKHVVKGAHTFREVEARIEQIEEEKSKGDAFEVFSEAYVATQLQTEYQEFWPWGTVPLPVRRAVYMGNPDKGSGD